MSRERITLKVLLILASVIVFALATFGVGFTGIVMVPLGLALFASSHLVP